MTQPSFKDAITLCKSIMRNGYDAHVVNTQLQHHIISKTGKKEIDLATDADLEDLCKIFPAFQSSDARNVLGLLTENGYLYRFYRMHISDTSHPEVVLTRLTPTMVEKLREIGPLPASLVNGMNSLSTPEDKEHNKYPGFRSFESKSICLEGLPDETLRSNYILGIRALRYAANFDLPLDPNTKIAIMRASSRMADYIQPSLIMEEWRKVEAASMWHFVKLLYDCHILHALMPEVAALSNVTQTKNDSGVEESVLDHTIEAMRLYPEGEFNYDWLGTFAMLLHDVGKLFTAEFYQGRWTFYQHHRVGAKVSRKILRRLHMLPEDADLICHLVQNNVRFQFMLTDKGIRKFKAQPEYRRLIAMSRANTAAREDNFTAFNHNTKYLARAETPEQMLEPLLNGNEIMEVTGLKPGPIVGHIRQALLEAQQAGQVTNLEEAQAFARNFTL